MSDQHRDSEPAPDEVDELVMLAALDALDGDDRARLDALLSSRPELRAALDEWRSLATELVDELIVAPPRDDARERVMAQIMVTPQLPADGGDVPTDPSLWGAPTAAHRFGRESTSGPLFEPATTPMVVREGGVAASEEAQLSTFTPRRRRSWFVPLIGAAAAAAILLVGGALTVRNVWNDDDDQMAAVMDDESKRMMPMDGTLGDVQFIHSPEAGAVVLMGSNVPVPDDGMVYELWAAHDDEMTPMGTFEPDGDGTVALLIDDFDPTGMMITVTMEPDKLDSPTGDVLASVQA